MQEVIIVSLAIVLSLPVAGYFDEKFAKRSWLNLTFKEANWRERYMMAHCFCAASVIGLWMFGFGLVVLGGAADGIGRYNAEHDRCLKHATNGYEIKQCR